VAGAPRAKAASAARRILSRSAPRASGRRRLVLWARLPMLTSPGTRAPAVLLAWGLLAGCSETSVPISGVYHPTLVEVSPVEFLGNIPCVEAPGAMRTYVATVFDVEFDETGAPIDYSLPEEGTGGQGGATGDDPGESTVDTCPGVTARTRGFPLPSSGPVSCQNAIAFARVIEPHRYRAEIFGYEGFGPTELGALAPGVPSLVRLDTGARVEPRWTIHCGDTCPATARSFLSRRVEDCTLVADTGSEPSGPSSVSVTLSDQILGDLRCGTGAGEIDHFEVHDGTSVERVACGETLTITEVGSRGTLELELLAYEAGNSLARWASTCSATLVRGLDVPATCSPFSNRGALAVDPAVALAPLGLDCAGLLAIPGELELTLLDSKGEADGPPRYVSPESCAKSTHFSGVESGLVRARARLLGGGSELGQVECSAMVIPGSATPATCEVP
jgi:hypothetical protein